MERTAAWQRAFVGSWAPPTASDRRFITVMDFVLAVAFLAAATALILVAMVELVRKRSPAEECPAGLGA
jgi:hypothetical protein